MKKIILLGLLALSTVSFALNEYCTRYHQETNSYEHKYIIVNSLNTEKEVNAVLKKYKKAEVCMIRSINNGTVEILLYIKKDN